MKKRGTGQGGEFIGVNGVIGGVVENVGNVVGRNIVEIVLGRVNGLVVAPFDNEAGGLK